jgi:beta-lactamase class D
MRFGAIFWRWSQAPSRRTDAGGGRLAAIVPRLLLGLLLLNGAGAFAASWREQPQLGRHFAAAGAAGTFVLYDLDADEFTVFDRARAQTRYIPGSTFKIANTLIGLQLGAVADVDVVLPYGGQPQPFKNWERDMPLREAIRESNVPVYQELARRIGPVPMREWVGKLDYGNGETGAVVDRFWLDGPLQISAVEQTRFLARLLQNQLPVSAAAVAAVREITLLERNEQYALHGKTGWVFSTEPKVGWWVGWVERDGHFYTFALNIDMPSESGLGKRVEVGRRCLVELGLL